MVRDSHRETVFFVVANISDRSPGKLIVWIMKNGFHRINVSASDFKIKVNVYLDTFVQKRFSYIMKNKCCSG